LAAAYDILSDFARLNHVEKCATVPSKLEGVMMVSNELGNPASKP
jgi:hypothetical protein